MLTHLPPEIFGLVVDQLSGADLKALSATSKIFHALFFKRLWHSITIQPPTEGELYRVSRRMPPACFQVTRKLHFRSPIRRITMNRCPHTRNYETEFYSDDSEEDEEFDAKYIRQTQLPPFSLLAENAEAVLRLLHDGQLDEFSWSLGTCNPLGILGSKGILPLQQSQIQSLSLINDGYCACDRFHNEINDGFETETINISPFQRLRRLVWKSPTGALEYDALTTAVGNNSQHLEELELDFIGMPYDTHLAEYSIQKNRENVDQQSYFCRYVLRQSHRSLDFVLPALRTLSLTQVPLLAELAELINFNTLKCLKLRMCRGWDSFLQRLVELRFPIYLKALEIMTIQELSPINPENSLVNLLRSFEGLEELFIYHCGQLEFLDFWEEVCSRHGNTLKNLIHHQRKKLSQQPINFGWERDIPSPSMRRSDISRLKEDAVANPFRRADLRFIGITCRPERIKRILLPLRAKRSLKIIHIRQSGLDLDHYESWGQIFSGSRAARDVENEASSGSDDGSVWSDTDTSTTSGDEEDFGFCPDTVRESAQLDGQKRTIRDELLQLAKWAFGPQGISSLQIIAFGDFSFGGRFFPINNLIMSRNSEGGSAFRFVNENTREWAAIQGAYSELLEACPTNPLFGDNAWHSRYVV